MAKKIMEVVNKQKQLSNKALRKVSSGKWQFDKGTGSSAQPISGYLTKGKGSTVMSNRAIRISKKK